MRFLDTNVIIRFLMGDDIEKQVASLLLMQRLEAGLEEMFTSEAVIAEVAYVLVSRAHYGLTHEETAVRLRPIVELRGLRLESKGVLLRAIDVFETHAFLDFEDALSVAHMESQAIQEIVSYDRDFDKVEGVRRVEP